MEETKVEKLGKEEVIGDQLYRWNVILKLSRQKNKEMEGYVLKLPKGCVCVCVCKCLCVSAQMHIHVFACGEQRSACMRPLPLYLM